jgi:DNA polymerase I
MDIELHPAIPLQEGAFTTVIAPLGLMVPALNSCAALQRYLTLYVCGNYSQVLGSIHRTVTALSVQRAFTAYQLLTILQEAHHTILFLEHDPGLYEDERALVTPVALALQEAARTATVICYAPKAERTILQMARHADRFLHIGTGETIAPMAMLAPPLRGKGQRTLDVF